MIKITTHKQLYSFTINIIYINYIYYSCFQSNRKCEDGGFSCGVSEWGMWTNTHTLSSCGKNRFLENNSNFNSPCHFSVILNGTYSIVFIVQPFLFVDEKYFWDVVSFTTFSECCHWRHVSHYAASRCCGKERGGEHPLHAHRSGHPPGRNFHGPHVSTQGPRGEVINTLNFFSTNWPGAWIWLLIWLVCNNNSNPLWTGCTF